jgi:hypothetical protein
MSLNLELSPELEAEVRRAAAREGVAPESYVLTALEERVRREGAARQQETESRLLEQISAGLAPDTWQRYHELTAKRRDDSLSDTEYSELLRLTEEVELWNARRLELLLELARLRGIPLRALVEQMGLAAPPYA